MTKKLKIQKQSRAFTPLAPFRNSFLTGLEITGNKGHQVKSRKFLTGLTLIEILLAMAILAVLMAVVLVVTRSAIHRAKIKKTGQDLTALATTIAMYYDDHGAYPADVSRGLPSGIESYLVTKKLPLGLWSDSCYDWENWTDPATGKKIYQISLRFCCSGGTCNPPISGFDRDSAIYYCIQGACRSHINQPINHPGICVNCGGVL